MVLLGPSERGKSTTLRMIAGLEPISKNTLRIDGRVVSDVPARDRDIAMAFQSYALYPHMTVQENMALGLRWRATLRAEVERRVQDAAEILALAPYLKRRPNALSGAQRQRIAVGRAIVRDPKVFLFDKPLSKLDACRPREVARTAARDDDLPDPRPGRGDDVGHPHLHHARRRGDAGRRADGSLCSPCCTFVAGFLGSPPMNLLDARLEDGVLRVGPAALPAASA